MLDKLPLEGCYQYFFSDSLPLISGVPQGSILGSLLLFVYINNMPEYICYSLLLIAPDDTNCHKHIINTITDYNTLQEDIYWCGDSDLNFNPKKCVHPSFKHNNDTTYIYLIYHYNYVPCNMCHKNLGIILSSDLSGINHYKSIIAHAYKC